MSIYGPRKLATFGTGYGEDVPQAAVVAAARTPELQDITEDDTDPGLLRQAADMSLSGLSMAGNFLDLPGSMVRDVATWLPGGIAARNPFDQILSPFSNENRTTGEEILQNAGVFEDDPTDNWAESAGKFVGSTALEIAMDPLTYLTLGASALGKGGKLLKAAGLYDDAAAVASKKMGVEVGKRRAKQLVSAQEVADSLGDFGRSKLVEAYNGSIAKQVKQGKAKNITSFDEIPKELLEESIGGNMRWKVPFMDAKIVNDIPLPGQAISKAIEWLPASAQEKLKPVSDFFGSANSISGEKIAELGDNIGEAIRYGKHSPVKFLSPYFEKATNATKTAFGQKRFSPLSRRIEEHSQLARDVSVGVIEGIADGKFLAPNLKIVGKTAEETLRLQNLDILERSNALNDVIEGITEDLPPDLEGARPWLKKSRALYDELDGFNSEYAINTQSLGDTGIVHRQFDAEGNLAVGPDGLPMEPEMIPSPTLYGARTRQVSTGPMWMSQNEGRRVRVKDGFALAREDYTRHLPKSVLQTMSVDLDFAGKFDKGAMGRRGGFKDWWKGKPDTGVMGSTPVDDAAKEALRVKFFEKYDPTKYIDPKYLDDPEVLVQLNQRHSDLFNSIVELNREQATKGVPMYGVNPAEDLLHRLDSGYMTIASTQGAREISAEMARLRKGSRFFRKEGGEGGLPPEVDGGLPDDGTGDFDLPPDGSTPAEMPDNGSFEMPPATGGPPPPPDPNTGLPVDPSTGLPDESLWNPPLPGMPGDILTGLPPSTASIPPSSAALPPSTPAVTPPPDLGLPQPKTPMAKPPAAPKSIPVADRITSIRAKDVKDWDKDDVGFISRGANFKLISPRHKQLDDQLEYLVKKRAMHPEDANVSRLIWAQSDLPYLQDEVEAAGSNLVQFVQFRIPGEKYVEEGTLGFSHAVRSSRGGMVGKDRIVMRSAVKKKATGLYEENARAKGVAVLLHEMGHMFESQAKYGKNQYHKDLIDEFYQLAGKDGREAWLSEFRTGNATSPGYTSATPGERFAEFFAQAALGKRLPDSSKLGKFVEGAMEWLKHRLERIGMSFGLPKATKDRIHEIMGEIGGFNRKTLSAVNGTTIDDMDAVFGMKKMDLPEDAAIAAEPKLMQGEAVPPGIAGAVLPPTAAGASVPPTKFPTSSKPAKTPLAHGDGGETFNFLDHVNAMGMNYRAGKDALVSQLGPDANRIIDTLQGERIDSVAKKLDKIFTKLGDPDMDGITVDELSEALRNDPDQVTTLLEAIDDEAMLKEATDLFDSISKPIDPDEVLKEFEVDAVLSQDVADANRRFGEPEEATALSAGWDAFTNLFKGSVTAPFPSFHVRNALSAFTQNSLNGIVDPTQSNPVMRLVQPYIDAKNMMTGKAIKDASKMPLFVGKNLTDMEATEELRRLIFSRKLVDSPGMHNDIVGHTGGSVAESIVGRSEFRKRAARPRGVTWLDTITPWKTPGVSGDTDAFAPIRVGRVVGDITEQSVRSAPYIALLKQGVDIDEAARQVKRLHVDYGDMTEFERKKIRRAVPFYGFTKGSTKYLASELAQNPGGAVGMSIKAAENAGGNDAGTPAHIRSGLNIPFGNNEDGSRNYLVGAGLMHEPPLQLLGPSIPATLFNAAGMLHPGVKLPFELLTNASLFQEGPHGGGRSLDDMDPLLGRTLSNVANTLGISDRTEPYRIPGGKLLEPIISNSPAARALHQVRKATDTRKGYGTRALDGLTGFKIATVDQKASDAVLREQAQSLMRQLGARSFSNAYIPDSVMATYTGEERKKAEQLQALLKLLNNRQRHRSKEKAATD